MLMVQFLQFSDTHPMVKNELPFRKANIECHKFYGTCGASHFKFQLFMTTKCCDFEVAMLHGSGLANKCQQSYSLTFSKHVVEHFRTPAMM